MTVSVAFGNLRNACLKHGIACRLSLWDGGQTIITTDMETGKEITHWSSDWGDESAVNTTVGILIDLGLITEADLEG